jgi:magnesium-transporting ATPase (P-type)
MTLSPPHGGGSSRPSAEPPAWCGSAEALLTRLGSGPSGLTSEEAAERLNRYGPNTPEQRGRRPLVVEFLSRFRDPLVLVLLVASVVSALTGDLTSASIITTVLLPFLPMRPIQILLNNLLYDVSELAIPLDDVDPEQLARPPRWDLRGVQRFMAVFGVLSSLFDAATFAVLLLLFQANAALFQTAWFMESLTTQVLVIFIIRTRRNPLRSRPSGWLLLSSLGAIAVANAIPFTPLGAWFGFVPPPPLLLLMLAGLVSLYLLAATLLNRVFT